MKIYYRKAGFQSKIVIENVDKVIFLTNNVHIDSNNYTKSTLIPIKDLISIE